MNFYNENEEDKKGAPVIPGSASPFKKSAFGKTPMFSRAAGGIMDRLKNLSRKDLAFVGIGLSVLVMAPVAEYMMSSSPSQDNLLKETFNPRSGPGGVMDPGINGLSTGSSDGSGEVITPLSQRDPMSLILGAQPAAAAAMPPSAPPTNNFRDAMKESGRAAFSEAAKSAGAPTVIPRMQSALRGLSFSGDGGGTRTSGGLNGSKIIEDAKSASSKAKSRGMIGPVAMAGYKGVASNTPNSASKGAFEKLRSQADRSAGNFSGGSAMNSLDKAAADAANVSGAGGLGAGGDSEKTGRPSGSTTKYDHNRSGETLEEAAAKARQQKALEWEFFKKYEFKKQLLTAVFGAVSTEVGKWVGGTVGGILNPSGPAAPAKWCWVIRDGKEVPSYPMSICGKEITCKPDLCSSIKPNPSGAASPAGSPDSSGSPKPGEPANNGIAKPEVAQNEAKDFDEALRALLQSVKETAGAGMFTSNKKVLTSQKAILAQITNLMGNREQPSLPATMNVVSLSNSAVKTKTVKFRADVNAGEEKLSRADADVSKFMADVDKILKPGTAERDAFVKAKTVKGKGVPTLSSDDPLFVSLTNKRAEAVKMQDAIKRIRAEDLVFQKQVSAFFEGQSPIVEKAHADIIKKAHEIHGLAADSVQPLEKIKEDSITDADKAEMAKVMKKIWDDKDPECLVGQILALRGFSAKDKEVMDDAEEQKAEEQAWVNVSPLTYLETHPQDKKGFVAKPDAELKSIMVTAIKRGSLELPFDLNKLSGLPGSELTDPAQGFINLVSQYRKELSMNAPGTSGGTDTPTPTATVAPAPTATVAPAPTATVAPVPTATVAPAPTATVAPAPTATVAPVPTATVAPAPTTNPGADAIAAAQRDGKGIWNDASANKYPAWGNLPTGTENHAAYKRAIGDAEKYRGQVNALYKDLKNAKTKEEAERILGQMRTAKAGFDRAVSDARAAKKRAEADINAPEDLRKAALKVLPLYAGNTHLARESGSTPLLCETNNAMQSGYRCAPKGDVNVVQKCTKPGNYWGCDKWTEVKIPLEDYSLKYSAARPQVMPARSNFANETSLTYGPGNKSVTMLFEKEPYKIDEYEMGVKVFCRYGAPPNNKWLIEWAELQKGQSTSANQVGAAIKAGFKPFGVGVDVTGNYNHTWNQFRHGSPKEVGPKEGYYGVGKPCAGN